MEHDDVNKVQNQSCSRPIDTASGRLMIDCERYCTTLVDQHANIGVVSNNSQRYSKQCRQQTHHNNVPRSTHLLLFRTFQLPKYHQEYNGQS